MKLQHYLGGLEGLPEPLTLEKRVFVEDWEKRIFGVHVAMMGLSNHLGSAVPPYPIDDVPTALKDEWTWADLRTGAEAMNPFDYFKYRYYEKWLGGITQFFLDKGYITEEELAERIADFSPPSGDEGDAGIDDQVIAYLRLGDSPRRDVAHPKFAVGSAVRIANVPADAHSRLPGYLRGHVGTVERVFEGDYAYFCHTGDGIGDPMPIYIVAFEPTDIWGPRAEDGPLALYAELFEAYLEPLKEEQS
jgi:nitrile hydratase